VSVLGSDSEKQATFDGLQSIASYLRSRVARQLQLRVAPEIQFKEDDTIARAARIESLLAEVKKQDGSAPRGTDDTKD
jgi:ribosome-binding factor A